MIKIIIIIWYVIFGYYIFLYILMVNESKNMIYDILKIYENNEKNDLMKNK